MRHLPSAQGPIKIGELNSYKVFPAFLEPYKKGWELAVEEVNAAGGVLGRKIEVISRDDNGNPGDAVRVAEELLSRERVAFLIGTFPSNVGLAVADFAKQRKVLFLAAEPLTDKIVWDNGNRYTFRLRTSTYMQTAMLDSRRRQAQQEALGDRLSQLRVRPVGDGRRSRSCCKAKQPGVEFVAEQAPPLGKIDAGAVVQALADAKPDAIFYSLFGPDLAKFVREGHSAACSRAVEVVQPAGRRARVSRSAEGRGARRLVRHRLSLERDQDARAHASSSTPTRPSSRTIRGSARSSATRPSCRRSPMHQEGGLDRPDKLIAAMKGLDACRRRSARSTYRAIDHQSTMGAYVGRIGVKDGKGSWSTGATSTARTSCRPTTR